MRSKTWLAARQSFLRTLLFDAIRIKHTTLQLPPWTALANSWTGMHEFQRDILPALVAQPIVPVVMIVVFALLVTLYSTGFNAGTLYGRVWFVCSLR